MEGAQRDGWSRVGAGMAAEQAGQAELSGLISGQFPLPAQEEGPGDLQGLELILLCCSLQGWDRDSCPLNANVPSPRCPLTLLSPALPVPCPSLTGSTGARGTAGSQGGGKWPSPGIWLGFILMGRS